ncbi:MAG: glycoside hydrolase family 3 protein [Gemmatimonadetes bacterium]|nr:glycoside hydrolase family 3 protein [Gemmatimonadota bacterium]
MRRSILLCAVLCAVPVPAQELVARPTPAGAAWVRRTLASLTLEQKVAQLITADLQGWYTSTDDPRSSWWVSLARDHGIGSFVFYGGTPRDVAAMTNALQRVAKVPILFAGDFEGGPGQQVNGATEFPANMAFAAANDTALMQRAAEIAAFEGRAMGIHLTYSPVVDIAWRPENPVESVRSFGGDLTVLGAMTRAYVRGYHANGMLTTAKHFPGRGDVSYVPGQQVWQWNGKPTGQVIAQDFAAFKLAIDAGVDLVMTEHLSVPSVTASQLPASVEPRLARAWLRDSLGFRGLLTTDDLNYPHVMERFGETEVALRAFEAGHDVVLKVRNPLSVIRAMSQAVRQGRITTARIDSAVTKVLTLKARLNLHRNRYVPEAQVPDRVGILGHWKVAGEVADRSLTLLRHDGGLPVSPDVKRVVHVSVVKGDGDPVAPSMGTRMATAWPDVRAFIFRERMDSVTLAEATDSVAAADLVIFSLFVQRDRLGEAAPLRERDVAFIERTAAAKPGRVIVMSYGNPHLIRKLPNVPVFLVGYGERGWFGNQEIYVGSFLRAVRGQAEITGRLPVRVSSQYPLGFGVQMVRKK